MFLKFFITYDDDSGKSGSASGTLKSHANPQGTFKLPEQSRNSFSSVMHSLAYKIGYIDENAGFNSSSYNGTREVLINVDDEAMFQLMTLAVPEYCYCTYNLETKKIGFGMTKSQAMTATASYFDASSNSGNTGSTGGIWYAPTNPTSGLMFSFLPSEQEREHLEFQTPEAFYSQVFEVLQPYIKYEKQLLFVKVSESLGMNVGRYDEYLENYYNDRQNINTYRLDVNSHQIVAAIHMFQNDDPDILEIRDSNIRNFEFMKYLCLKIMQISNETF